jgi:hypothetical protein
MSAMLRLAAVAVTGGLVLAGIAWLLITSAQNWTP